MRVRLWHCTRGVSVAEEPRPPSLGVGQGLCLESKCGGGVSSIYPVAKQVPDEGADRIVWGMAGDVDRGPYATAHRALPTGILRTPLSTVATWAFVIDRGCGRPPPPTKMCFGGRGVLCQSTWRQLCFQVHIYTIILPTISAPHPPKTPFLFGLA